MASTEHYSICWDTAVDVSIGRSRWVPLSQTPEEEFSPHFVMEPDWSEDNNYNLPAWRHVTKMGVNLMPDTMRPLMELKSFYEVLLLMKEDAKALFPKHRG